MFLVALVISSLTQRIRAQVTAARRREQRTASLYAMARQLAGMPMTSNLSAVAVRHVSEMFDAKVALLLDEGAPVLTNAATGEQAFDLDDKERSVAEWAFSHGKTAGLATDTLPAARAVYVPLRGPRDAVGVLGVCPRDPHRFVDPEQRALLDVFATQITTALERARLVDETQRVQVQMQTERLRSSLLSSVSHDLRTPLAVITGAASVLVQNETDARPEVRHELAETIHEEAERLNRLVRNLLDMTKITSGAMKVKKAWQPLEEVIGAVLSRMEDALRGRTVDVSLPKDLPPVPIDGVLIEQVFINVLENALKYTPKGSSIDIAAHREDGQVVIDVDDRGPGVPPQHRADVFEKFYRLPREGQSGGAGLGLAISRGIVEAHGGTMWVDNRDGGGAAFRFTIPIEGTPPAIASPEEPA
jgi:two-component system sensor histidine kinase KdpD